MSRTFARHLDIDDVTYSAKRNVIKSRDARRTKPTAGILSLQISSEPFVKFSFQAILQFTSNIIPNIHAGHHKTDAK